MQDHAKSTYHESNLLGKCASTGLYKCRSLATVFLHDTGFEQVLYVFSTFPTWVCLTMVYTWGHFNKIILELLRLSSNQPFNYLRQPIFQTNYLKMIQLSWPKDVTEACAVSGEARASSCTRRGKCSWEADFTTGMMGATVELASEKSVICWLVVWTIFYFSQYWE